MNDATSLSFSSLRVRPDLHRRAKIIAARRGQAIVDLADELFTPALDRAEQELSRLKADRPTRRQID